MVTKSNDKNALTPHTLWNSAFAWEVRCAACRSELLEERPNTASREASL